MPKLVELPSGLRPKTVPASIYVLLTGSGYGKGSTTSPAAMITAPQIQAKHGEVSRENMLHAFNRLVSLGLLQNTGEYRSHDGRVNKTRLNEKFVVVKSREEALDEAEFTVPETPAVPEPRVTRRVPAAPRSVAPTSAGSVAPLDQRVADLEAKVESLLAALRAV